MNFGKGFSVTLLLGVVVGFTAFVYAEEKEINFNFKSPKICNEKETNEFISIMKNASNNEIDFAPGRFIVLTDSETEMNENLRLKLLEENSTFIPFHSTFNNDINETFSTTVILCKVNISKNIFLIHANSIDSAVNIYKNVTNILSHQFLNESKFAFALTLSKNNGVKEQMIKKLDNLADEMKKYSTYLFKNLKENSKELIAIFTKQSSKSNVNDFFKPFINDKYNKTARLLTQNFKFNSRMQKILDCGVETVNKKVVSGIKNLTADILKTKKYQKIIQKPNGLSFLESFINCIRNVVTSTNVNSANKFYSYLDVCKYNNYTEKFENLDYYIGLDRRTIDLIFHFVNEYALIEAIEKWREPLKHFHLEDDQKDKYQKNGIGELIPRNVTYNCYSKRNVKILKVTGIVVKLSDLELHKCSEDSKVIEIFAIEKVIIDKDILLIGREIQMVIIAPIWDVNIIYREVTMNDKRVINLSGKNGVNHEKKQAKDGTQDGNRNGAHGLAGLPGGPAGSFYGIAEIINNAEKLIILANGGKGGNGQHGGNGADGANGPKYEAVLNKKFDENFRGWNYTLLPTRYHASHPEIPNPDYFNYKVFGKKGKKGGNGGNGGIKGNGGQKGFATIVELSDENKKRFHLSAADGEEGEDGTGGKFGVGGKNGKNVDASVSCSSTLWKSIYNLISADEIQEDTGRAESGLDGSLGTSQKRKSEAEHLQFINIFPTSVNEYKTFLRPYLSKSNSTEEIEKLTFYNNLNTRENIINMYDTYSLVDDFIGLEKQFFYLYEKINITSSYEQLKNRIETYKNYLHSIKNTEYESIIDDLEDDIKNRLDEVPSIYSYYDVNTEFKNEDEPQLERKVNDLDDFLTTNKILFQLNKNVYDMEEGMKEGAKLIKDTVLKTIPDIEETLEEDLNFFLTEIVELKKEIEVNQTKLEKNRQSLESNMLLKVLFGILKVGCVALGVINPALGLVSGVAVSAITVLEASTFEGNKGFITVLPKAVENLATESENLLNDLMEKQKKAIEEQEKYVTDRVEKTGDKTNKDIKAFEISPNAEKYVKATSEVLKIGTETAISIMKDKDKVSEVDKAIEKNEETIKALNLIEENFYNHSQSLLSTMHNNLGSVAHNVENMNQFQQAIAKWNITRTIEDIKRTLHNVTKNFKADERMNSSFDELIKAFKSLFELHDILQKSKEKQKEKIDYTILHIAHDSIFWVSDNHLKYALSELAVVKILNNVAERYQKWFAAFKQYVFPYHGEELKKYQILHNDITSNINKIKNSISRDIKFLLETSHSTIFTNQRRFMELRGSNYPDERSKFTFYTWRNNERIREIHSILNGKQTILIADIRNNDFKFDAVKFSLIKLLFTSSSPDDQEKLNKELNNYDIELKHLGDSKYNYSNTIYEIKTTESIIETNYDITYGKRGNNLGTILSNGPYLLSPYATWIVKLKPIQAYRKFDSLLQFRNDVNLELIGNAEYTQTAYCDSTCKELMLKYYTLSIKDPSYLERSECYPQLPGQC